MPWMSRDELMADFDRREERLDAIRANPDRWRCPECKREIFVRDAGRQLVIKDELTRICWACVDEILMEALQ